MGAAVGEILGNAIGVAISPVPIIAVILMLFTSRAVANSLGFLLGWVVGLTVAGAVLLALGLEGSDGGEADSGGWIKIGRVADRILRHLRSLPVRSANPLSSSLGDGSARSRRLFCGSIHPSGGESGSRPRNG